MIKIISVWQKYLQPFNCKQIICIRIVTCLQRIIIISHPK